MEYENMRMPELKSLTRDCGLLMSSMAWVKSCYSEN